MKFTIVFYEISLFTTVFVLCELVSIKINVLKTEVGMEYVKPTSLITCI